MSFIRNCVIVLGIVLVFTFGLQSYVNFSYIGGQYLSYYYNITKVYSKIQNDIFRRKNNDGVRKDANNHISVNEFMNQWNALDAIDSKNSSWFNSKIATNEHVEKQRMSNESRKSGFQDIDRLKVYVFFHSHNDAGYVKTYREYYHEFTRHILDLLTKKMNEFRDATFVWTEICFLQEWWKEQTAANRSLLQQVVKESRLEISPGGWVIADEATVPYTAYLDQLSEGRHWVKRNMETLSDISLDLDQFDLSAGAHYVQHHYGIRNAVVKRVHHGIKEFMMKNRLMNFWWRQASDKSGEHDTFVQVEPYEWLSFTDSCGPDRNICSDLDLTRAARLPDLNTPEINRTIHLQHHNYNNLDDFATKLVKALHQKSQGYQHKQSLLPMRDSFRYRTEDEWNHQYRNTQILMGYINSQRKFKTNIAFGSMKKFFDDLKANKENADLRYPNITEDFMPFKVDSVPSYWSGYFTTRPFLKRLGREVQVYVTATDCFLALSLMKLSRKQSNIDKRKNLTKKVTDF
ncbi:MA2A1-like protein [Mya arenaria]|uniref:MA2A1-like protein n=1 Tax=Mya arenaria TaxID=6604 RepID=A0ABY7DDR2_MYAAR|nr:MA2A1-like protein [Mya arenaria]